MFVHNGEIAEFDSLRRKLVGALSDELWSTLHGTSGSEVLFALIVQAIGDTSRPCGAQALIRGVREGLAAILQALQDSDVTGVSTLNFAITDGRSVVSTRCHTSTKTDPPFLCYTESKNSAVIVSSEPLAEEDWKLVPQDQAVVFELSAAGDPVGSIKLVPLKSPSGSVSPVPEQYAGSSREPSKADRAGKAAPPLKHVAKIEGTHKKPAAAAAVKTEAVTIAAAVKAVKVESARPMKPWHETEEHGQQRAPSSRTLRRRWARERAAAAAVAAGKAASGEAATPAVAEEAPKESRRTRALKRKLEQAAASLSTDAPSPAKTSAGPTKKRKVELEERSSAKKGSVCPECSATHSHHENTGSLRVDGGLLCIACSRAERKRRKEGGDGAGNTAPAPVPVKRPSTAVPSPAATKKKKTAPSAEKAARRVEEAVGTPKAAVAGRKGSVCPECAATHSYHENSGSLRVDGGLLCLDCSRKERAKRKAK
jgi:hypothetical protein